MATLTKKRVLVAFIVAVLGLAIILYLAIFSRKKIQVTPIPKTGASYKNLTPGVSTQKDLTDSQGNPIKEIQQGNTTTLEYASQNPNFNNQFLIQQGTVNLIKQIVAPADNINISVLNQKYGNYDNVLYGTGSSNGFNLYVYPGKGIAYIGNQQTGDVTETWYFPPTTLDNFKALYASDYSDQENPVTY